MILKKNCKKSKINWAPYLFICPFIITYVVFQLYPAIYSLVISFYEWNGLGDKLFIGINNYRGLLTDERFFTALKNTIMFIIVPMPFLILGGLVFASMLSSSVVRASRIHQISIFMPYLISTVAAGFLFGIIFDIRVGLVNKVLIGIGLISEEINWFGGKETVQGIINFVSVWKFLGYYILLMMSSITSIDNNLIDAAKIDGANSVQRFIRIIVPQMKNILIFIVIQNIIGGFQMMEIPRLLLEGVGKQQVVGGPDRAGLTMLWYMYDTGFGTNMRFGYACAIAVAIFMITMVFSIVLYTIMSSKEE